MSQPIDPKLRLRLPKATHANVVIHGAEAPSHYSAGASAIKDTSFIFLVLWPSVAALPLDGHQLLYFIASIGAGWLIFRSGRSALQSFARLERMHRIIEEERWEIEHHREREKEEVRAFYQAKGFSGPLLDEVVHILMADDNRLLEVMLKEELGLNLASQEHPILRAAGSFAGVLLAWALFLGVLILQAPFVVVLLSALIQIALSSALIARFEKNQIMPSIIWNLSVALFAWTVAHTISQLIVNS